MSTILITGGTGLVGKNLTGYLVNKGHHVIILTRSLKEKQNTPGVEYALWDVKKHTIDLPAIQKADHIMHLAGAGVVDKKWTAAYKKEILESRTQSSKLIVDTLRENPHKVQSIVSSSAIGWYGEDKEPGFAFTESDPPDQGFLGQTCLQWEESIEEAGMVSWIHIDDLCRLFLFAAENIHMKGSYNAVAPNPVNNKKLTLEIAQKMKGSFYLPMHVPVFMLKLILGTRSVEVLKSTTVSCTLLKNEGFTFLYPTIEAALQDLLRSETN